DPVTNEHVGMAPGAKWIAVKIFDDNGDTTDAAIHAGFQWCLAPTDLNGRNPDPGRAPDIVSNSWGDDNGADQSFQPDLQAWLAAGIFSTWAAGNAGPDSGTVNSPGSLASAFSVGATDSRDVIASFSSRGPSPWGEIKPEVVAPGASIRSAIAGGGYAGGWNGTSMATPHAAGLAALLLEASGHALTIEQLEDVITRTAIDLGDVGEDNGYGYGRIDAYGAVGTIVQSGTFSGHVSDESTGQPLEGALVRLENHDTGHEANTRTAADGSYSLTVAAGVYTVTATCYGYMDAVAYDIEIRPETTTQLDFRLRRQPHGTLTGRVTSDADGQPVPGTIVIEGTVLTTSVALDGFYSLTLPIGHYALRVVPEATGHRARREPDVEILADAITVLDVVLPEAPRLLVVDADAGEDVIALPYYAEALDDLLYVYDLWRIVDTGTDVPDEADLAPYDVVIWVQPRRSPGYIGAWPALSAYLDGGGRVFLSGQDIGYWDDKLGYGGEAYARYLYASLVADTGEFDVLQGSAGSLMEGLQLELNTGDSAGNQISPDVLAPTGPLAHEIVAAPSGQVAGLGIDACGYRVVYLGFGLEGVGPRGSRGATLDAALMWLASSPGSEGFALALSPPAQGTELEGRARFDLQIANRGLAAARFAVAVESSDWPAQIVDAATMQPVTQTEILDPCEGADLRLLVQVPSAAATNRDALTTIIATSQGGPYLEERRTARTVAFPGWRAAPDLPAGRYRHGVAGLGCALYVIGGFDDRDASLDAVSRYDLTTGVWSQAASKPTAAANSAVVTLNGRIYAIGGFDGGRDTPYLSAVEVYDPAKDIWTEVAPLPVALSGPCAAPFGGRIYAFGGMASFGESYATYVYDPDSDAWSVGSPTPGGRLEFAGAVTLGDAIYIAGGWPDLTSLWRYDPAADAWQGLRSMAVGRHSLVMATDGRYLYVAGGGDAWQGLASAERYDPLTNTWLSMPSLSKPNRAGAAGAMIEGRLFVLGGAGADPSVAAESLSIVVPLGGTSLSVVPTFAQPGGVVRYQVVARNPSAADIQARWQHRLPNMLTYVGGSATDGVVYNAESASLSWQGLIPAMAALPFDFEAQVSSAAPIGSRITSTVSLEAGGCSPEVVEAHLQVLEPSLASSVKGVDKARAAAGDLLTYEIQVTNGTPFTIGTATVVDPIPQHTRYVPGSVEGASYSADRERIEWSGMIPPARLADPEFAWIDATAGQLLSVGDDDCVGPLELGFELSFYGQAYSDIYVNSNGMVLFGACSDAFSNKAIPNGEQPNAFAAPFWDDLQPGVGSGRLYFAVVGAAPRRIAVVEWHQVRFYGSTEEQTFQVLLHEGTHRIVYQYLDVNGARGAGSSATVGIENGDGTEGIQYLFDGSPLEHSLYDGLAIEMVHSDTIQLSRHVIRFAAWVDDIVPPLTVITNTVEIDDGLRVYPRSATTALQSAALDRSEKLVAPDSALGGETVTYMLRIRNTGDVGATEVTLVDPLPAELAFVPGSLSGQGASYNAAARQVEWQGQLPPDGSVREIAYQARLLEDLPLNTAVVNGAALYERGALMAVLQATLKVNEVNLEQSAKTTDGLEYTAGDEALYTISLINSGLAIAPQVALTDVLPLELTLLPETLSGGAYDEGQRALRWEGVLAPGAPHQITFGARIRPEVHNGTVITNEASLSDGLGGAVILRAPIRVLRGDLSSSQMSALPSWTTPGGRVTFTLRLENSGDAPIRAELSNTPPETIIPLPETVYASAGQAEFQGRTLLWGGEIQPRALVIVRYASLVAEEIPPQPIVNEARLIDEGGITTALSVSLRVSPAVIHMPLLFR
ncbi:MAG: DUF11 domain-containing protein, partial [Anaerolineae bacterium]|nr:DUF11 domain-containing protein [Anaerolineae bacterium]